MTQLTDQVDALFAEWDKPASPGCALAVIQNGEMRYKRAYGMADLERGTPISPASVFDLGSTGKQFTAMLVAILARQGALALDEPLRQHVPEMHACAQAVTLRHLLHHTSGIRDYTTLMEMAGMPFENFYHPDELLDLICRQTALNFSPGEAYRYSNSGYFLLGVVAARVAGRPYTALIQEGLLDPLGMKATTFNDDGRRIVPQRALAYEPGEGGGFRNEMSFCGGYGDGAILSSVEDLYRWDQNFYHNVLGGGGQELIELVHTTGVLNNGEALEYAFGLEVSRHRGLQKVAHGGSWAGYRAELLRFPDQRLSVICLANLGSMDPTRLAQQVADLYLEDQYSGPEPPTAEEAPGEQLARLVEEAGGTGRAPLPTARWGEYAGEYRSDELNAIYRITLDGEQLRFRRGFAPAEALQPAAQDLFTGGEHVFQFERDGQGRVRAFRLKADWVQGIAFQRR